MKGFFLLLGMFYSLASAGQSDFSLTPIPAFADSTAEADAFIAHAMIKNHSDETIVIAWQRLVNDLPEDWVSYICSNITCAPPDVSMGTFSLTANDSTNLDCYFQPEGVAGSATVELRLFLTGDTTQVINATYRANAIATSTQEIWQDRIKVFPNPTADFLILPSNQNIDLVEVYDIAGQRVSIPFQTGRINVSTLPTGIYLLKLYDQDHRLLSINRFQKIR